MTHKSDIVWLDTDMTVEDVKSIVSENLYEFYPIADGDLDHVKGVIHLKDLVLHLHEDDFNLVSLTTVSFYWQYYKSEKLIMTKCKVILCIGIKKNTKLGM